MYRVRHLVAVGTAGEFSDDASERLENLLNEQLRDGYFLDRVVEVRLPQGPGYNDHIHWHVIFKYDG